MATSFKKLSDLINALYRGKDILQELFANRKKVYREDYASEFADGNTINFLINNDIVIKNNGTLEINDSYLQFFEEILKVNEEINLSRINEYISSISDNMEFYFNETNENRKYIYVQQVRKTINTIARSVTQNVIDLQRNIEITYKNEPNFKIKRLKLNKLQEKYHSVSSLIKQCEILVDENSKTFFAVAADEMLNASVAFMKIAFNDAYHTLLSINNQIIDYIQKIDYQLNKLKKIRKLKYLKDQFTIEKNTNIRAIAAQMNPVWAETATKFKTLVSVEMLRNTDAGLEIINSVSRNLKPSKRLKSFAENISQEFFNESTMTKEVFDYMEIKSAFSAQGRDLYSFIGYNFRNKQLSQDEKLLLFCQLAIQFGNTFNITDKVMSDGNYCYSIIYPK